MQRIVRIRRLARHALPLVVAASVVAACSPEEQSSSVPAPVASTLSPPDSSRLRVALANSAPKVVANGLAVEVRKSYLANPRRLLPKGSSLVIETDEMQVSGNSATVPAKVTVGSGSAVYLLVLRHQSGKWLLVGTAKK